MLVERRMVTKSIYLLLTIFLILPLSTLGQEKEVPDSVSIELIDAARKIIASAESCALITIDQEGRPRVRAMDAFLPESDFTVWFGTNAKSRKVDQIKNNPTATLYYLEKESAGYVMICGTAEIVDDQDEKEKRWKTEWEAFYPNDREDYLLIKFSPEWMEVVSYTYGIHGDPVSWEPAKVIFDNE